MPRVIWTVQHETSPAAKARRADEEVAYTPETQQATPLAAWLDTSKPERDSAGHLLVPATATGRATENGADLFLLDWSGAIRADEVVSSRRN